MIDHEPSPDVLAQLCGAISVTLVGYTKELVRLHPDELLPRYNRVTADFYNKSASPAASIFVTISRDGSKIGGENFYTIPLNTPELGAGDKCRYELLSFDSFNLPFESIRINMTTPEEYVKRRLSKKYI